MKSTGAFLMLLCFAAGCGEGTPSDPALGEPIRVLDGAFHAGALPGAARSGEPESAEGPRVTALEAPGGIGAPGQRKRVITGRTSAEAHAIAVQVDGYGEGYWVRPVDGPDAANAGERLFRIEFDLADDAPPGKQILRFVALDGVGIAGVQRQLRLCVTPSIPDNLNACDPTIAPPAVVVRLAWDVAADLDLRVRSPEGRWVSAEHPRTVAPAAVAPVSGAPSAPGSAIPNESSVDETVGVIDRDGGQGCREEGARAEHLVFQERPAHGRYLVYARLFDPCGYGTVPFTASIHVRESETGGTWKQTSIFERGGAFAADAAGEASVGTYLFPLDL